ncbi:MAG: hypothetical protein AAF436_03640 [Myxococcota bacterium]
MADTEDTLRVLSNLPRVERIELPRGVTHTSLADAPYGELAKAYLTDSAEPRCFVFNGLSRKVWLLSLLKALRPNAKRKLVVIDLILSVPTSFRDRVVAVLRRMLLSRVDLFISYARNTEGIQEIYRVPASRFRYVPFKINNPEIIEELEPRDGGYILVAGQTRRDFATFRKAIEGLSLPVRIVAPAQEVLARHGSNLSPDGWPDEVVCIRDATGPKKFLPEVAGARLVVLPIVTENITPSGIGVCLVAMGLHKCVIVSAGPVSDGMMEDGQAIVVPAGDPVALREAIVAAWEDDTFRNDTAQRGFEYATSLGDENRLHRDMFDAIVDLCRSPSH